jgi:hypothetical protein
MKLLFTIILTSIIGFAYAQSEHAIPKEKWSKDFFLSDEFCAGKGLKPGETNQLLRAWNSDMDNGKFSRVVDIRMYFESPSDAADYLNNNIAELSEKGDPVYYKTKMPQVSNLKVFREGAGARNLNASLGLKSNMYYFVFTVKNYIAKVFVSAESDMTVDEASVFAKEAAGRLNTAIK